MPKKKRPSTKSPASAAKSPAPKRKAGRPFGADSFKPTAEQRALVEMSAGLGITQEDMVMVILNAKSKRPISEMTLRRHFHEELRTGMVKAKIKGGANLLKLTETSAAAAIFFAKVRLGMRENVGIELPPPPDQEDDDATINARRIAFTLYLGAQQQAAPKKPQPKAKTKEREPA